jgi:hypothetical protein
MKTSEIRGILADERQRAAKKIAWCDKAEELLNELLEAGSEKSNGNGHAAPRKATKGRGKTDVRALQGRYMGLVRTLTVAQKAEVKKVKLQHGFHASFKTAKGFLNARGEAN